MKLFTSIKAKSVNGVPSQKTGGFHDTESQRSCHNSSDACILFSVLKNRFFSVHHWKSFCNNTMADFRLYDEEGCLVKRMAKAGDFVKIDILASPDIGTKYYWVKIDKIIHERDNETEKCLITFVPAADPTSGSKHIAHFYNRKSSSTFMISRESRIIRAAVYGRNERPNFQTDLFNSVINIVIAFCAMAGMSKIQWKDFADGILDFD